MGFWFLRHKSRVVLRGSIIKATPIGYKFRTQGSGGCACRAPSVLTVSSRKTYILGLPSKTILGTPWLTSLTRSNRPKLWLLYLSSLSLVFLPCINITHLYLNRRQITLYPFLEIPYVIYFHSSVAGLSFLCGGIVLQGRISSNSNYYRYGGLLYRSIALLILDRTLW